jgi:hypothetical protein
MTLKCTEKAILKCLLAIKNVKALATASLKLVICLQTLQFMVQFHFDQGFLNGSLYNFSKIKKVITLELCKLLVSTAVHLFILEK